MAMRRTATAEKLYTIEEFENMPEFTAEEDYELIDGKLVKNPMPGTGGEHDQIADNLRDAIKAFDPARKLGVSLPSTRVKLHELATVGNTASPDVSYWKAERNPRRVKGAMPLPDLAVEIHSPGDLKGPAKTRSAMVKVARLFDYGVPIIWVVYPDRKIVEVYHLANPNTPVSILAEDEYLDGEDVIPGFRMKVGDLFENMD